MKGEHFSAIIIHAYSCMFNNWLCRSE